MTALASESFYKLSAVEEATGKLSRFLDLQLDSITIHFNRTIYVRRRSLRKRG